MFLWFYVQEHPNAHRQSILVTHIRAVFRTYSRKALILISTGSGWGARRLDIGLNLHHQALLLLCVCKCEKRRLLIIPVCSFAARICNWYDCISMSQGPGLQCLLGVKEDLS